jgi:hypothetical protein
MGWDLLRGVARAHRPLILLTAEVPDRNPDLGSGHTLFGMGRPAAVTQSLWSRFHRETPPVPGTA